MSAVSWHGENSLTLCGANVDASVVDPELGEQIRASFLLAGPLLARFGRAEMPPPGGDFIGRRRLDPHIDGFEALGAVVRLRRRLRAARPARVARRDVFMDEPSVMATENVLMAAALTPGHDRHPQRGL